MSMPIERVNSVRRLTFSTLGLALFAVVIGALCNDAIAHSTVKGTTPASGSILSESPAKISIEFNEAARLTAVVAASAGGSERKLTFEPVGSATSLTILAPQLPPGRNEVRWTALSKDGHPIKGTIIIVVKPGAAAQSPPPKQQ